MQSKIAQALRVQHEPVALLLSDDAPEGAIRFQPGKWGCIMMAFMGVARGRTAAFDSATYGCWGGGVGLGFGDAYHDFPGGVEGFTRFLSTGSGCPGGEEPGAPEPSNPKPADRFAAGEHYVASPEVALRFVESLPIRKVPKRFVVLKPLKDVDPSDDPTTVVFTVDADQLSALVVLANFRGAERDNVRIPFVAGCQSIGILPWKEAEAAHPRAVVGLIDITARKYVRKTLGSEALTFAVPWKLYRQMEEDAEESFLSDPIWTDLLASKST